MKFILISCVVFFCLCTRDHKKAVDIYNSGTLESLRDFIRIDNGEDSLLDTYRYRLDTSFTVDINYGNDRNMVRGYAFYYDGKKVGRWLIHDYQGRLVVEYNYKNDQKDGYYYFYNDDGSLKERGYYKAGTLSYKLTYTNTGVFVDSLAY